MTRVEKSVVIRAPLESVWAFTSDWRNLRRYFVYVDEVKPRTEQTLGKGARLDLRVRFLGRTMDSQWECVEYLPNEGWTFHAALMGVTAVKRWRFLPAGDGTKVIFTLDYQPAPPVIGPIVDALVIKRAWQKLYERSFEALKQVIEAEGTVSKPGLQPAS